MPVVKPQWNTDMGEVTLPVCVGGAMIGRAPLPMMLPVILKFTLKD